MTSVVLFNNLLLPYFYHQFFNYLEMFSGGFLLIACIFQRAYLGSYSTKENTGSFWFVKLGQLGLWMQMMCGVVTLTDGTDLILHGYTVNSIHVVMLFWVISSLLVKGRMFYIAYEHSVNNLPIPVLE